MFCLVSRCQKAFGKLLAIIRMDSDSLNNQIVLLGICFSLQLRDIFIFANNILSLSFNYWFVWYHNTIFYTLIFKFEIYDYQNLKVVHAIFFKS